SEEQERNQKQRERRGPPIPREPTARVDLGTMRVVIVCAGITPQLGDRVGSNAGDAFEMPRFRAVLERRQFAGGDIARGPDVRFRAKLHRMPPTASQYEPVNDARRESQLLRALDGVRKRKSVHSRPPWRKGRTIQMRSKYGFVVIDSRSGGA